MTNRIESYLKEKGLVLLDGSTGTELIKRGVPEPPIAAVINKPYEVWKLAHEYYMSGSDAVLTNSLTASELMLKQQGIGKKAYEFNYLAATIACKARPEGKLLIGSVGPTGELLEPYGELSEKAAIVSFVPQIKGLYDGGVDAIVFETFLDLKEMACAVKALNEVCDLPFICSLTYDKKQKGYFTMMGDRPADAIEFAKKTGAFAVGANCGVGIDHMIKIIEEHRNADPDVLLWAKPNAGYPELVGDTLVYNETPEYFAKRVPELLQHDLSFVGGCCGTGPDHIAAMRDIVRGKD